MLQIITLPADHLVWEEKGEEAIVQGKLFDVKEWHTTGRNVILTGLFDEQETGIVKMLQKETDHSKSNSSVIRILLLLQCFIAIAAGSLSPIVLSITLSVFPSFYIRYSNPFFIVLSPPPRLLSAPLFPVINIAHTF